MSWNMPDCQSEAFCCLSRPTFSCVAVDITLPLNLSSTWAAEQKLVKVPQLWDPILANETAYCIKSSFQNGMFEWSHKTLYYYYYHCHPWGRDNKSAHLKSSGICVEIYDFFFKFAESNRTEREWFSCQTRNTDLTYKTTEQPSFQPHTAH